MLVMLDTHSTETLISAGHDSDCRCCRALALALNESEIDVRELQAELARERLLVAELRHERDEKDAQLQTAIADCESDASADADDDRWFADMAIAAQGERERKTAAALDTLRNAGLL